MCTVLPSTTTERVLIRPARGVVERERERARVFARNLCALLLPCRLSPPCCASPPPSPRPLGSPSYALPAAAPNSRTIARFGGNPTPTPSEIAPLGRPSPAALASNVCGLP